MAGAITLNDTELKNVNGGVTPIAKIPIKLYDICNSRGNPVGFKRDDGTIVYWKCTHCNGPVHRNTFYFCDKCDDWWLSRANYIWSGTEAELIAAAN